MSQKAEKPTLSGQRLKTRKRDEKEKYDPSYFRDELIKGLNKTDSTDLEAISKFLDSTGNRLDYRRYSDVLFDILFAGGQLEEPEHECRTQHCVFTCEDDVEALRHYYDIFIKLIRRYQYLEKAFEAALTKIMKFLRGFSPEERCRLARFTSLLLANGCCTAKVIIPIFDENLVKDGISKTFATILFETWLKEKDVASVYSMLKKANIENKLSELLPPNKRSLTNIQAYFHEQCLGEIAEMIRMQAVLDLKKELNKNLKELIDEEKPVREIVAYIKEQTVTNSLPEHDVVVLVWKRLMAAVEWNKKEELVAEQALKHLRGYIAVLAANSTTRKAEMALITRVQEFCYDNMNFMNVFHKIIVLFYKADVLSEEAIIRWYKTDHLAKGKSVFLDQLKVFVTWLETAEEGEGVTSPGPVPSADLPERLTARHFPSFIPAAPGSKRTHGLRDCRVCNLGKKKRLQKQGNLKRKQSSYICLDCDRVMCVPDCFRAYHTLLNYKAGTPGASADAESCDESD